MQPRLLVFALITASVWTGLAGPIGRSHSTQNAAGFRAAGYQPTHVADTRATRVACCLLEDDAADDLRLSFSDAHSVISTLPPCARSEAVHSLAPIYRCLQTLESQHIMLQV